MPGTFRLALGKCSCKNNRKLLESACDGLRKRMEQIQKAPHDHELLARSIEGEEVADGKAIQYDFSAEEWNNGEVLFVVGAFMPTWWWPTYFSLSGVGHRVAEGIILEKDGKFREADNDVMWYYR